VEVIISPSETLNDTHSDKNPSNEHQNSSINENSEHNDDNAGLVLQEINSAKYYFKIEINFIIKT